MGHEIDFYKLRKTKQICRFTLFRMKKENENQITNEENV